MIQFILGAIGVVALSEISKKGKMPMMAKGGGVGIETKYDLKGWRKSQNKWVVINKNPMSYEEAQEMFESARKSGLYDTLSIESNMLKKPKYATFSVN